MARGKGASLDWGDVAEAPRADLPRPSRERWRMVRARFIVWMLLISFPLLLLTLGSAVATIRQATADRGAAATSVVDARALTVGATASAALRNWLAIVPAPLPGGQVVSAGSPSQVPVRLVEGKAAPSYVTYLVPFVVAAPSGLYSCEVAVVQDSRGSVQVLDTPSLVPMPPVAGDGWQPSVPWPGREATSPSPSIVKAVEGWANAYVSGDPVALRLAVGDPSEVAYYTPLAGVSSVAAQVKSLAVADATGATMMARVELALTWSGQVDPPGALRPLVSVDVLVERADTAAPIVTAWGGPGSGPTLTRYGNAANGEGRPTDLARPSLAPTPSPKHTPTVNPKPSGSAS